MTTNKFFIIRLILITLLLLSANSCKKEIENNSETPATEGESLPITNDGSPIPGSWLVRADGGLNARETPDLNGKISFLIPQYSIVEHQGEVGDTIEIEEKKGRWTKVKLGNKTGFVFGSYLAKAKVLASKLNSDSSKSFTLYSIAENAESEDCRNNYMNYGCLVVVYKEPSKNAISSFEDMIAIEWIDKTHIAESWIIGDAGYGGEGIRSIDIHTKANTDIWKMESQMSISEDEPGPSSETLCLKNFCYDLIKNQDIIAKIKSTRGLKFYEKNEFTPAAEDYKTEIQIGKNSSILFIPERNIVIRQ